MPMLSNIPTPAQISSPLVPVQNYSPFGRLPNYRSSYQRRFHPYGRVTYRPAERASMETVDHLYEETPVRRVLALPVVPEEDEELDDEGSEVANLAIIFPSLEQGHGGDVNVNHLDLVELVVDFALAMRRQVQKLRFVLNDS